MCANRDQGLNPGPLMCVVRRSCTPQSWLQQVRFSVAIDKLEQASSNGGTSATCGTLEPLRKKENKRKFWHNVALWLIN